MTDTRTTDPTTTTSPTGPEAATPTPTPDATGSDAVNRANGANPTPPAERLSTADIAARRGPDSANGDRTDGDPRRHASDLPGPAVAPLFSEDAASQLRDRWTDVQAGFVDEPRSAVEQADSLVAEVMKRLADGFATERQALEQQWSGGGDASTEDLRVALRRYRSFFDRLLSI